MCPSPGMRYWITCWVYWVWCTLLGHDIEKMGFGVMNFVKFSIFGLCRHMWCVSRWFVVNVRVLCFDLAHMQLNGLVGGYVVVFIA